MSNNKLPKIGNFATFHHCDFFIPFFGVFLDLYSKCSFERTDKLYAQITSKASQRWAFKLTEYTHIPGRLQEHNIKGFMKKAVL